MAFHLSEWEAHVVHIHGRLEGDGTRLGVKSTLN